MSDATPCPYCGEPRPDAGSAQPQRQTGTPARAVDSLYLEVRRIREIAEARQTDTDKDRRLEELTLEVHRLRETVARLRGTSAPAARPSPREVTLSRLS